MMKQRRNRMILILPLLMAGVVNAADSGSAPSSKEILEARATAIRDQLSPIIEETLQQHCGTDCPSFKLDVQFKKPQVDALGNLGFAKARDDLDTDAAKQDVKQVSLSVLVQERIPQKSRDSLKQILSFRLGNAMPAPVTVSLKPLDTPSPLLDEKLRASEAPKPQERPLIEAIAPALWPLTVIALALLGLLGTVLVLRHRRKMLGQMLAERLAALEPKAEAAENAEVPHTNIGNRYQEIKRAADLRWLIEDRAARGDVEALQRIASLYPSEELSAKVSLSPDAVRALAKLPEARSGAVDLRAAEEWLERALDGAHWSRLEEEKNPVAELNRMSDSRLSDVFQQLGSAHERAALIAAIDQARWPTLLGRLGAEDRVQLGLAFSQFEAMSALHRQAMLSTVCGKVRELAQNPLVANAGTIEDFSLYLSEKEGQKLWLELSNQMQGARAPKGISIERMMSEIHPSALVEVCMALDFETLRAVIQSVSGESQTRVLAALPRALRERLGQNVSSEVRVSEMQLMRARAALAGAYRRLESGGAH